MLLARQYSSPKQAVCRWARSGISLQAGWHQRVGEVEGSLCSRPAGVSPASGAPGDCPACLEHALAAHPGCVGGSRMVYDMAADALAWQSMQVAPPAPPLSVWYSWRCLCCGGQTTCGVDANCGLAAAASLTRRRAHLGDLLAIVVQLAPSPHYVAVLAQPAHAAPDLHLPCSAAEPLSTLEGGPPDRTLTARGPAACCLVNVFACELSVC